MKKAEQKQQEKLAQNLYQELLLSIDSFNASLDICSDNLKKCQAVLEETKANIEVSQKLIEEIKDANK